MQCQILNSTLLKAIQIVVISVLLSAMAGAEPYLAIKNGVKCSACHVNPIGGGLRAAFGNIYGQQMLPEKASEMISPDLGKIADWLNTGANFRFNGQHISDDAGNDASTFTVDSAQVYLAVTPKSSPLTLYIDQQVAPGAAVNREAFVMYRFDSGHYLKAGKMYTPFGLRLEDDSAFVRQVTGFNFDSSDNGVELGLEYTSATINLFVMNGTGAVSNNDDRFLYGVRAEKLFNRFRLGTTAVYNDGEQDSQTLFNIYGGLAWRDFSFLWEVDYIKLSSIDTEQEQWVGLFEVNYQASKGLNLKLTSEYFDPDIDQSENQETRYSLVAEYAPISNLQLRAGLRVAESIPQRPQRSSNKFFVQTHLYF